MASTTNENVHFCGELFLPSDKAQEAISNALKENPQNAVYSPDLSVPAAGGIIPPSSGVAPPSETITPPSGIDPPSSIGLFVRKMWQNGRTLNCSFIGGSPFVRNKVQQFAHTWENYANLKFQFVSQGPAEIRIGFTSGIGSWSYVGTDALSIASNQPTMNYGWFDDQTPDEEFSRTVIHEFGHAIGCIHEHQQPNANIQWNKPVVYASYAASQGWSQAQVDAQVFARYSSTDVKSTAFDATSIMEYPIPKEFTLNGFSAPNNTKLSATDIAFIGTMYPLPGRSTQGTDTLGTGVFNTSSVRPWSQPQQRTQGIVNFDVASSTTPNILLGLNWLDIGNDASLRITAKATNISKSSMTVNLDSWADTVNYSSGCAYLQLPANDSDYQFGQFNTTDDHDWNKPQAQTSRRIQFPRRYNSTPSVVVFLTSLDLDHSANYRIKCYASDIKEDGFTVNVDSWADSKIYNGGVTWLAYPTGKSGIVSGSYNIGDIRPWNKPSQSNSSTVNFPNPDFKSPPKIFMALNYLDVDSKQNPRVRLSASSVSTTSMEWHIDSWADTVLYSAGASYVAIA